MSDRMLLVFPTGHGGMQANLRSCARLICMCMALSSGQRVAAKKLSSNAHRRCRLCPGSSLDPFWNQP